MQRILCGARRVLLTAVVLAALSACGGGGGGEGGPSTPPPVSSGGGSSGAGGSGGTTPAPTSNLPPRVNILGTGDVRPNGTGVGLGATLGGVIRLDANGSTDPDNDSLTYEWTLTAQPSGSAVVLTDTKSSALQFKPDLLGTYVLGLKVDDGRGGQTTQSVVINVDNRAPVGSVVVTPSFAAVPTEATPQSISIGDTVAMNAEGSTDPDGHAVSISFALVGKPAGSTAALTVSGKRARFDADLGGTYRVKVTGSDGRASFETTYVFNADNRAPQPVLISSITPADNVSGGQILDGTLGYVTQLDSSGSTDPDNNLASRTWQLLSRPAGSSASLTSTTSAAVNLTPDMLGDYVIQLTVFDTRGARSTRNVLLKVANRQPVAQITSNASPSALPNAPAIRVPARTEVRLRGDGSSDPDGDALTYLWSIVSSPTGSTATLSSTTIASPMFTPVVEGSYVFQLRVTDSSGAYSERSVTMNVGTYAPVVVLDRSRITTVTGDTARASASMSFDRDGDALTYAWQIDARPSGSALTLSSTNTPDVSVIPDVPGTYQISVVVSDGRNRSTGTVEVRALASQASSVALNFAPLISRYSTGLDKLVSLALSPNAVRVIDPFNGSIESIALPAAGNDLKLSPDGKLAVVKHDGLVSLLDLQTASVIHTIGQLNATAAFVDNDATIMLYSPSSTDPTLTNINGRTGEKINESRGGYAYWYKDGVYAHKINSLVLVSSGVSPSDIAYMKMDPVTRQITAFADSPYHGDYLIDGPLYLNDAQDLVFVAWGDFFRTSDLRHAGKLSGLAKPVLSMSNSAMSDETLVLEGYPLQPFYRRYTGSLMLPQPDISMPKINGAQSYGIQVFHSSSGRHVLLAQTGSTTFNDAGVRFYVIAR